jgi:hypothetical protein
MTPCKQSTSAYTRDRYCHLGSDGASLEYLSDASFLGKPLVFPANVRLDWKVIAIFKHSSLFGLIDSDDDKEKLSKIDTRCQCYKTFFFINDAPDK